MQNDPLDRTQPGPRALNPLAGRRHPWHGVEIRCIWREAYADEVWTCHGEFPDQWNVWTVYPSATHPKSPSRTMWWYGVWIHHGPVGGECETPSGLRATDMDYRLTEKVDDGLNSETFSVLSSNDSEWLYGTPRHSRFNPIILAGF